MNDWQLAQQIKYELQRATWPSGTREVVFGDRSVYCFAGGPATEDVHPPGFPFALVTVAGGTPDPDDPDLIEQQFTVAVAAEVAGDPLGEHAVIGGSRADYGSSQGAGILEIGERVRSVVQKLTAYDGAAVVVSGSGTGALANLGQQGKQIALSEFTVTAMCTSQPRYTAPQELRVSGGTWSWEGAWTSSRFDFLEYHLGYVSGSDPVTRYADLDATVYQGTDLSVYEPPIAGRTYHLFAVYNGHGATTAAAYSDPELGSFLIL